jgi:hypothetical protein
LIGGNSSGGGTVTNLLIGAALTMQDSAHAGNNTLIAGTATAGSTVINNMWGNAASITGSNVTLGQDKMGEGGEVCGHQPELMPTFHKFRSRDRRTSGRADEVIE